MLVDVLRQTLESEESRVLLGMSDCILLGETQKHASLFGGDPSLVPKPSEVERTLKELENLDEEERLSRHPILCERDGAIFAAEPRDCPYEDLYDRLIKGDAVTPRLQFYLQSQNGSRSYSASKISESRKLAEGLFGARNDPIGGLEVRVRTESEPGAMPPTLSVKVYAGDHELMEATGPEFKPDELKLYADFDAALTCAKSLPRREAEASLRAAISKPPLNTYPFKSAVKSVFSGADDYKTEIRKLRERLLDARVVAGHLEERIRGRVPAANLISKMKSVLADEETYEEDEKPPTDYAKSTAASMIGESWEVDDLLAAGDVSTFFGELNVSWRVRDRQVRLICFSEPSRAPCIYHEEVKKGALGDYGMESNAESQTLKSWLDWLQHTV